MPNRRDSRTRWDTTMKAMTSDTSLEVMLRGDDFSVDNLYFRTKWPWPMKDRLDFGANNPFIQQSFTFTMN